MTADKLRIDLIGSVDTMRGLDVNRVPKELFHYTISQLRMIHCIWEMTRDCVDGILLKELAQELDITPAATSEMVETLVRRGALTRKSNPNDRRAIALRLAPELEKRFLACEEYINLILEKFLDTLSREERECGCDFVAKILAFLKKQSAVQLEAE